MPELRQSSRDIRMDRMVPDVALRWLAPREGGTAMRPRVTPSDIIRVLWLLEELWLKYPEQRLGQLLLNLTRSPSGEIDATRLWNADEDAIDDRVLEVIEMGWTRHEPCKDEDCEGFAPNAEPKP